jgi:large subunit ribosomal protein L23
MHSAIHIIKKPLVTEKHTFDMNEHNRYAFKVPVTATKTDIKKAIEHLYDVRVIGVATQIRKGGSRRTRRGIVTAKPWKKALVRVHPEDRIELF